jgi:hypothetical protein
MKKIKPENTKFAGSYTPNNFETTSSPFRQKENITNKTVISSHIIAYSSRSFAFTISLAINARKSRLVKITMI